MEMTETEKSIGVVHVPVEGGFEGLYRREYPRVAGTAYLLTRDKEEARDLAQETFSRAFSRWGSLSHHPSPEAWLQKVVTNLSFSWHRRLRLRRSKPAPRAEDFMVDPVEPVDPQILRALGELSDGQRAVVVLRYYADLSVAQVAEILGKKPGTVKALSSQGVANMRRLLGSKGEDHDIH